MHQLIDLITVVPHKDDILCGELHAGDKRFDCILGRSGIQEDKREGDGATPAGRFPIRKVFYRADRIGLPSTNLPVAALRKSDGWCDSPDDPRYNKPVEMPYPASAESMWREDHQYDVVVVVGHNDDPPLPGKGSAIFLHVSKPDGAPTAGCVALKLEDILELVAILSADCEIEIRSSCD